MHVVVSCYCASMRKAELSATNRLALLLPALNASLDPYVADARDVRRWCADFNAAIAQLLASFTGSPACGFVAVMRRAETLDPDALQSLAIDLDQMLRIGFDGPDALGPGGGATTPMRSLRFGVRDARGPVGKRSALRRREQQAYSAAGAYVLQVDGSTHDIVLYVTLRLLTSPDMAGRVTRCKAPVALPRADRTLTQTGRPRERCDRWILRPRQRGQPQLFCKGGACKARWHAEQAAADASERQPRRRARRR